MGILNKVLHAHTGAPDGATIDALHRGALFGAPQQKIESRRIIRSRAAKAGITLSSLHALYTARGQGKVHGFTVPALNCRGLSYDFIRAILRSVKSHRVGPFIIEIARSEMGYTEQLPDELTTIALAAALREGYRGPLVLQGDHFQIHPTAPREKEIKALEQLVKNALASGMNHIDIDASKTVDLTLPTLQEQQHENARITAHLTKFIRDHQIVPVTIGGEIGEIGGKVSTVDELRAFMHEFRSMLPPRTEGINKVAVQSGTSHGGVPNTDGSVAPAQVNFSAMKELSNIARTEYGMAGAVQHGASTLPEEMFVRFPEVETAEIHLSTAFQNIIFSHPSFPKELLMEIDEYLVSHFRELRKPGQSDEQFIYTQRKRAWGPFKKHIVDLPIAVRTDISRALEEKVDRLFTALRMDNTIDLINTYHE